jgi:hypothetical protein
MEGSYSFPLSPSFRQEDLSRRARKMSRESHQTFLRSLAINVTTVRSAVEEDLPHAENRGDDRIGQP